MNAIANLTAGKGYERGEGYTNCDVQFLDIENIHVMRDSLNSYLELCHIYYTKGGDPAARNSSGWHAALNRCGWLEHVRMVIRAADKGAELIGDGFTSKSIMVHCSDGWDRTPQITGLTQMLCDGESRTIRGLEMVIEKEWIAAGHQFATRSMNFYGVRPESMDPEQFSPVFIQFIESIWQISCQFPTHFEFNQLFLLEILDHHFNGRSATFLVSFDKDREHFKLRDKALSVWTILNQDLERYRNPWYKPETRFQHTPLRPNYHVGKMRVWEAYYCRGADVYAQDDFIQMHEDKIVSLNKENQSYIKRINELETQLNGHLGGVRPQGGETAPLAVSASPTAHDGASSAAAAAALGTQSPIK